MSFKPWKNLFVGRKLWNCMNWLSCLGISLYGLLHTNHKIGLNLWFQLFPTKTRAIPWLGRNVIVNRDKSIRNVLTVRWDSTSHTSHNTTHHTTKIRGPRIAHRQISDGMMMWMMWIIMWMMILWTIRCYQWKMGVGTWEWEDEDGKTRLVIWMIIIEMNLGI